MTENEPNADAYPSNNAKRARSVPPIIDLAAQEIKSDQQSLDQKETEKVDPANKLDLRWIGAALAGGLIGGVLVAGAFSFIPTKDNASDRLAALEVAVSQLAPQESLKPLDARLASIESKAINFQKALEQNATSSPELAARFNKIEEALSHIPTQTPSSDASLNRDALRLTLAMLIKDKVIQNLPFDDEYKTLIGLAGPSSGNAFLQKFSTSGLMSYDALKLELLQSITPLKSQGDAIPSSSAAWTDRVFDMLSRVVKITPVDQINTAMKASIAEIETAITNHQGAKAFELWQSLPEADKKALAKWASHLRDKLDAETAADALITDTLHKVDRKGASQ
jgi:hypothetical protein